MKFVLWAVAVVAIAGLGSSSGAGLPLTVTETRVAPSLVSGQAVFVNKAELVRLHPGWRNLSDMKTVLAGALKEKAGSDSARARSSAGRSKSELAAIAAVQASAALDGLESRKHAALKARREAMKSQMMKSAEAQWKAEAREVERTAAAETKAIDERHTADLVNARIKVSAAQTAADVSKLDASGMDKRTVSQDLQNAKARLDSAAGENEAEKGRVMADASAKVDALRRAAEKRIDDQLSAYQSEQNRRITESISSARVEIAQELGPSSKPVLFAEMKAGSLASLESTVAALRARIDKDVDSVVRELARGRGLRVTFERGGSRTPDATAIFAGLIKKHGWNAGGPVASGLGSS